jgi:hypothetical protein
MEHEEHLGDRVEEMKAHAPNADEDFCVDMVVKWFERRQKFVPCECEPRMAAESTSNWDVLCTYTGMRDNGRELKWHECVAKETQVGKDHIVVGCDHCLGGNGWELRWPRRYVDMIELRTEPNETRRERRLRGSVTGDVDWTRAAGIVATFAGEHMFESRQGLFFLTVDDHGPVVVIFNNDPYADKSLNRHDETATFREWLVQKEINELAYATSEGDGYSFAMVLDAGVTRLKELEGAYIAATMTYWKRTQEAKH